MLNQTSTLQGCYSIQPSKNIAKPFSRVMGKSSVGKNVAKVYETATKRSAQYIENNAWLQKVRK